MRHVPPALGVMLAPLALAVQVTVVSGQTPRDELVARLDSLASVPVAEGRVVGLSVAVVHGADTLLMRGYGSADIELDVPTPERAVYEIGSVTKQFTAAAILQLRDDGKLDLDDDITKYLPDYPTAGHHLPVRRLLDHTSGIKGYTEMPAFGALSVRRLPRDSLVALFSAVPFEFAPGDAMIYNNSAYFLLGLIIEKVSGMSYEDYVEQRLFEPLGMRHSMYCSNTDVVKRRAHGYQWDGEGFRRADYIDHSWPYAAGSLCSTTGDLIAWLDALHGGRVLTERSYTELTTPSRLNDGTTLRYAMGLSVGTSRNGARMIGHGGGIPGFLTETQWYPDEDLKVVVIMNSAGPASPAALATELAAAIIPPTPQPARAFSGSVAPLTGLYTGPSRGRQMSVEVTAGENGGLAISVNGAPARTLEWVDGLVFRADNTLVTFEQSGGTGPATVLRYDTGGGHYVLKRT